MSLPTYTWTSTSLRSITVASTNSTVAELLVAINAAIGTDSVWWDVSSFSAGNYVEIKRRASTSPTGEFSTVRILFFGGSVPASAALTTSTTAASTNLYCCLSVDANTTGPGTAFTAGAPYSTKFVPGTIVCPGAALQSADSPKISLIESAGAVGLFMNDVNGMTSCIFGNLIEINEPSGLMDWCVLPMGGASANVTSPTAIDADTANNPISPNSNTSSSPRGCMWKSDISAARSVGRCLRPACSNTAGICYGVSGGPAYLPPVPMIESSQTTSSAQTYVGVLHQIRFGPQAQHLQTITSSGTVQAIHGGPPNGLTGWGAWFDQVQ